MNVKSLYEIFKKVRPILLFIAFTLFVIAWVMKYGAPGGQENAAFWTGASYYLAISIIVIGMPISFKKNAIMLGLWMFYNLYEFILVLTGVHTQQVQEISIYLLDVGVYVLMAISLATYFSEKMDLLWLSVQLGLTVSLGCMAFLFHSELMTYIPDLLSGIFENSRVARVGIGFYNVNILGGLSGLLVFVSLVNVVRQNFRYSSIVTALFGGYLLLNSGTRSSMLALMATILFCALIVVGHKYRYIYNRILPGIFFAGELAYGLFMGTVNQTSGLAKLVSSLTSERSILGSIAFDQLDSLVKLLFGTGMRIQGNIRENFFDYWPGYYGLDGEPQWFVFTTGIVGALVTLVIVTLSMYKISQRSKSGFLFMVYFGTIMTFEHVFFNSQSVSAASGILLTVIFVSLLADVNHIAVWRRKL